MHLFTAFPELIMLNVKKLMLPTKHPVYKGPHVLEAAKLFLLSTPNPNERLTN